MAEKKTVWIQEEDGAGYVVIEESVRRPGFQNRYLRRWSRRADAVKCFKKKGFVIADGVCPLPRWEG